ncbi:hypothetical protein ED733_005895 [Metarhizium rileyi]|uniref:FAD-binding FR-type domain-containing protein n=1 Tax=Metarhizium rileyi (strain RCEF 4871) TaxID=1649241 RepID=A0A5C6GJY6_METRR|nr:hypothetical protein ED733_005895 [Metarhizium rileyi]
MTSKRIAYGLILLAKLAAADGTGMVGLGKTMYDPPCAFGCRSVISSCPLLCSPKEKGAKTPPECYTTDQAFMRTLALCISTYCSQSDHPSLGKIEDYWESHLTSSTVAIFEPKPAMSYSEALRLAKIDEENGAGHNGTASAAGSSHSHRRQLLRRHGSHGSEDEHDEPEYANSSLPIIKPRAPLNVTSMVRMKDWTKSYNGAKGFDINEAGHAKYTLALLLVALFAPVVLSLLRLVPGINRSRTWGWVKSILIEPPALYILLVSVLNTVFLVAPYVALFPQTSFASMESMEISTIGNRAGVLAMGNMVALFIFSARNNLLLWLTDWPYDTFILLHRWLGYWTILLSVVHALMLLGHYITDGMYAEQAAKPYWTWGIVAVVCAVAILPSSLLVVRQKAYELFLCTHQLLVVIFVVGYYYHIWERYKNNWGYEIWVFIAIAVWVLERSARLLRVASAGLKTAVVSPVEGSNGEYVRVDIENTFAAGVAYLYFPTLSWRFWENHPFSIASSFSTENMYPDSGSERLADVEKTARTSTRKADGVDSPSTASSVRKQPYCKARVTIAIRVRSSMTARLAARVSAAEGPVRIPVFLEGSCHASSVSQMAQCTRILCIAGGVGLSAVLPILHQYGNRPARLCWGIRNDSLVSVFKDEVNSLSAMVDVETHIGARMNSCQKALGSVRFNDAQVTPAGLGDQYCRSRQAVASMYLCLNAFCEREARAAEVATLNETCVGLGMGAIPRFSLISNYTAGDIERLRRIKLYETFAPNETVSEVVVPAFELHKAWFDTLDAYNYVRRHHFLYGSAMIAFWVVVVAVGAANRVVTGFIQFLTKYRLYSSRRSETARWMKRRVLIPATFGYRCTTEVWCGTIPPRIQTLTIAVFAIMNVVYSICGYKILPVNLYFHTATTQWLRYVSDRTGIISFANFPIIWLFGMRNNFAIWLTGWDFGTYSNFHRWVARIATLQAVVHSLGYTALVLRGGWTYFVFWWTQMFWIVGEVATVLMCALVACSIYWLRRQKYELFLILHIGMSLVVLVTMLGHVSILNGHYDGFFWVPMFIWVFDRVVRIVRMFWFNPRMKLTVATATYNPSTNIVRLRIPCQSKAYKVRPGTYYYLSVIDDKRFWESHPFTVASVSDASSQKNIFGEQAPLLDSGAIDTEEQEVTNPSVKHLTFLIRPYDSFTARLRDLAAAEPPQPASMRVLVDGPYGHSQPLHRFDHVVFVVGGSGVVVPMSYIKVFRGRNRQTRSIHLHWATREAEFAADVLSNDMGEALGDGAFAFDLYFSADTGRNIDASIPSHVKRHYKRPDARTIILTAAEKAAGGSLAVVACGPAKMADDSRRAVTEALDIFPCQIEYFEESFRW